MDLTGDHLFRNLLVFTGPIVLLSLLQLLYTSADLLVVDFFGGGYYSFMAVSSNGPLINLIIGLFVGVGVGCNVVVAKARGENNKEKALRTLSSSLQLAIIFGIIIGVVGYFLAPYLLEMMNTPASVLPLASVYLRFYFVGLPFLMVFNFLSAILRGIGDSKRPLYALIVCGLINIGLNFLFVTVFHLDVEGVAIATVISEALEATMSIFFLVFGKGLYVRLSLKSLLKFHSIETREILDNGIPAGLQSLVFSISNVLIQRSVNDIGSAALAGNSASIQAEGYIYSVLNGFSVAVVAIVAQNVGAGNIKNIKKILWYSMATVTGIGLLMGAIATLLRGPLIGLFIQSGGSVGDEEYSLAMTYGQERLMLIGLTYFLDGLMDSESAFCRGLGHSSTPTVITFFGCCLLRIVFIETLYRFVPYFHTLPWLWASWPISWVITDGLYFIFIPRYIKDIEKEITSRSKVATAIRPQEVKMERQ